MTARDAAQQAPRTKRLGRSAVAGAALVRASVAHLSHKAAGLLRSEAQAAQAQKAHEARLGHILFSALNQLKGTALKASQLLSLELGLLPEGLRQALAQAHYQATPLNRALVIKLMRQEFGQSPQDLYRDFEPQAFAAASLGQVHAATLHSGEAVAVKLQYPGMAASVHSDLALLRGLLQTVLAGSTALPQAEVMERVLADVERTLVAELDYMQEARNLRWFGQHLHLPGLVVPQPVETLSSARVLTMQHLSGVHLDEWLSSGPTQAERDHYGQLLFDSFMHCAFGLRRLQADPHPGNYLFMLEGRLGLLDFGCCQSLSEAFCTGLRQAWSARLRQPPDTAALHQAYGQLGLIAPALSLQDFSTQLLPLVDDLLAWQVLPFGRPVFDFGTFPPPPRPGANQHQAALRYLQAVPSELPYFDRTYLGLTQMLRNLGARVRTRNPWISSSLWEGSQPHKVG